MKVDPLLEEKLESYSERLWAIIRHPRRHPVLSLLFWIGLLAVAADAYSTLAMMASGVSEEGNGFAAAGMDHIGRERYVLLASLEALLFVGLLALPPRSLAARTAIGVASVVVLAKAAVAVSNFLLWGTL